MLRLLLALAATMLLWGAALAATLAIKTATNRLWSAEVGYLAVAAVVAASWEATHVVLRLTGRQLPYRPE